MSEKYLVVGATGSIGSNLAEQLYAAGKEVHLIGRDEERTKSLSEKLNCKYTVSDVLENGFVEKIKSEIDDIKGIAYCVGSIDLKPLRMVSEQDFTKCMKLNLYSAVDLIKGYQESLKKNKGSIVLFSTVAAQRGFTNHAIIASTKAAVEGLTVSLAAEFAPNIRVNCIAPSLTNSKIAEPMLKNKVLGLIFDKSSTRTRVSFQVAMTRLGGTTIDLNPTTSQIGRGEPIKDTARVLSRYCDVIAIRTFDHLDLEEYAKWSTKPVINALTDLEHPCQALADFLTIKEEFLDFKDVVLTFIGDGNNVANSLILCGALLGVEVRIACPKGYEPNSLVINKAYEIYKNKNLLKITNDPNTAVLGANVLYTDVWSSMGEENQKDEKEKVFNGFTIDSDLVRKADKDAIILHCLPAYRSKEITDEIFESHKSRIFDQAENRLHAQQALLSCILQ